MTNRLQGIVTIFVFLNACIIVIVLVLLWQIYFVSPQVVVATPTSTRAPTSTPWPTGTPAPRLSPSPTSTRVVPLRTPGPTLVPTITPEPSTVTPVLPTATPFPATPIPAAQPPLSGRLAFTLDEGGGCETYVANMDGSGLQKIWSRMHQPDFDPTGTRLAVNGELPNHLDLQVIQINPDNTPGQHQRVSVHYEDSWPSWSPDGSRIVCVFNIGKRKVKILSDLSEATEGALIDGPGGIKARGRYTVWVGDRIAFSTCDYWESGSACGIYTIDVGGGNATRISDNPQDRPTDGWGNQVLYMSPADGDWEIWRVSSTGGGRQQLTNNSAQDGLATSSPDGQHIAFLTNRTGSWEIWVMNADGTGQRSLFFLPGVPGEQWTEARISWGR